MRLREAGLDINVEKTKVLVLGDLAVAHPTETLSLDGVPIERVANFLYLGSLILNTTEEVLRKESAGPSAERPTRLESSRMCGSFL